VYGLSGERQLFEWQAAWLPGYQGAAPVRIGNAASDQLQLNVFGELIDALYQARKYVLAPAASAWAQQQTLIQHLEDIWELPDCGIWEVRGGRRQFTHSKVMAWVALDRSVRDAERFKLEAPLERWRELRDRMHATICKCGFDTSRKTFTQSFGSSELDASLLLLPIVGFLPPNDPRICSTVSAIEQELMVDGFVMRYRTSTEVDGLFATGRRLIPALQFLARRQLHAAEPPRGGTRPVRAPNVPSQRCRSVGGGVRSSPAASGWKLSTGVLACRPDQDRVESAR
jgi:GH15 family glucan-1,4-alpha-glucosidase